MIHIFDIKKRKMMPEQIKPIVDSIGLTATGVATYLNIQLGFLKASFSGFIFSPQFNGLLTIVISLLSILWISMKIYDQWLTTKIRKHDMNLQPNQKKKFNLFKNKIK